MLAFLDVLLGGAAVEAYGAPKDEPPVANDNPPRPAPAADAIAQDEEAA